MGTKAMMQERFWLHSQLDGAIVFSILSIVFVALRCAVKVLVEYDSRIPRRLLHLSWEDILILASLIAFLPLCACAIVDAHAYIAAYSGDVIAQRLIYKANYGLSVIYPLACALPKLSICCMYLSLFSIDTTTRRITYAMILFLTINAIAWFVPTIIVCQPISTYWTRPISGAKCINVDLFSTWISLPHIVSDLIMFCLPMPLLWNTQMKLSKKIEITFMFVVGSVGIVGACIRLALYTHRQYVSRPGSNQTTRSIAGMVIVSYVEPGMYLIAACLLRLRPLIARLYATLSVSLSSLIGKGQESNELTQHPNQLRDRKSQEARRLVPRIEIRLTGQGNLNTLAMELDDLSAVRKHTASSRDTLSSII